MHEISWRIRPRSKSISDDCGICFFSDEMEMRCKSTLSHPATIEYELDSFAHSFSNAANELEQREHWHSIAGRVSLERSIVALDMRNPYIE